MLRAPPTADTRKILTMLEHPWEIEAASLAITVTWGDVPLHTAHHSPPQSFYLGDATADCVLPDAAVGPGRLPLLLAERDAVYLVLHPSMDPEGTITAPGNRARTVADLARPGMAETSAEVPGAFLVKLQPGTTASLSIADFTIAITLETKAACAIAGHFHVSRRSIPFQIGSAALHLAVIGFLAFTRWPPADDRDPLSDEQLYFIQQALERIDEKEEAAIAEAKGYAFDPERRRTSQRDAENGSLFESSRARYTTDGARRDTTFSMYEAVAYGALSPPSASTSSDADRARRRNALAVNEAIADDSVNPAIDTQDDRYSTLPIAVDTAGYATLRRGLLHGALPPPSSIRPEAFLNSVDYAYAGPSDGSVKPFLVHLAAAPSPFTAGHHLLRVGVQGRRSVDAPREILARDVKIQVDFNPAAVRSYRLLGFENRTGRGEDARRDTIDAGKIVAGHTVTAVYDVVLATTASSPVTVRLRHRAPFPGSRPEESVFTLSPQAIAASFAKAPRTFRLAVALAGFAEILRKSPHAEAWRLADVERIAAASIDDNAVEQELMSLIRTARSLDEAPPSRGWGGRVADASLLGF